MNSDNMQYTNGITAINYQPKDNEADLVRKCVFYDSIAYKEPEEIIRDYVDTKKDYPFNFPLTKVTAIECKLEKTTVTLLNNKIKVDQKVFIDIQGDVLRIWNAQVTPHNVLGTQGNTYVDGFDILDFDNNSIKCAFDHSSYEWNIPYIHPIKRLTAHGNGNVFCINDLASDMSFRILGKNKLYINSTKFNTLTIGTTNSVFNFIDCACDTLSANIRGTGTIEGLTFNIYAHMTLIGSQTIILNKKESATYVNNIHGPGKIVFI